MKTAGHITEEDCISYMKDFFKRSSRISDTWELSKSNEKTYLSKKVTRPCSCKQDSVLLGEDLSVGADISDDDFSVVGHRNRQDILTFEYQIIYSDSYSVPVLYFNVYRQDGSLLPLPLVWELVPDHYRERLASDKWTFLTQTEHPYLGRPFYQLHPCHTDKLMACVFTVDQPSSAGSGNYLIGWLCAVGPVVLLDMPFEYGGIVFLICLPCVSLILNYAKIPKKGKIY